LYDVIVVGGGPVGSYLAYRMAHMGYKTVVIERRDRIGEKSCCTGIISQECARSFSIEDNVVLRQANSACFFAPGGKTLWLRRPETQAIIVDRSAFDRNMADRAKSEGVSYVLECLAGDVTRDYDRTIVTAQHQGRQSKFEGRVVVIASGFGFSLTRKLGLGQVGDFAAGAQAEVNTGINEVEVHFGGKIAPGFFAWLVPTAPGQALAGLLSRRSPGLYLQRFLSSLQAQGKIVRLQRIKPRYGGIPLRPLVRTFADRMLVVGDAAGQVKPTTGGGIYYGLLCADIAATTLHQGLKTDDLSARYLANYQRRWQQKLRRELVLGYRARQFYERLTDDQIDRMFDIITSAGIDKAVLTAKDFSFDWHGSVILRLLGHQAIVKTVETMKLPLSWSKGLFKFMERDGNE